MCLERMYLTDCAHVFMEPQQYCLRLSGRMGHLREEQPQLRVRSSPEFTISESKKNIFGAISLDLFAVLLGGATALLPAYARDILHTGPWGLGLLRLAPAVGALITSIFLAHHPIRTHAGHRMFLAVSVFGLATIGFGLSHNIALSLGFLCILGAADVTSVVIRTSLVQLETPDEMRGRVSAVNSLFVGTSNQLGQFESGVTATWFGLVPATVIGGVGSVLTALIWMGLFPGLRQLENVAGLAADEKTLVRLAK